MKKYIVLYICSDFTLGGSTRSLFQLITSVKKHVYPIVLFPYHGEAMDYFVEHGIECYAYKFLVLYQLSKNSFFNCIFAPWRWHVIKYIRYDLSCILYLFNKLRKKNISIVHSNTSPINIGYYLSKLLNCKHVWHIREFLDLDFHVDVYGGFSKLQKKINSADARIAISNAIAKHWNLQNKNTYILHNAITSKNDCIYNPLKEKYCLFVAYNLSESKGTSFAIRAFAKSGLSTLGYHLKLIGNVDSNYKLQLQKQAFELNCLEAIEFVPLQNSIKPFFENAAVYIMSSLYEGLGRVTAEAMFYGCPVVARATGGTLDLIFHDETGYLFNTIDECALLLKNACLRNQKRVILQAQKFVSQQLSTEYYSEKILEIYDDICNNMR